MPGQQAALAAKKCSVVSQYATGFKAIQRARALYKGGGLDSENEGAAVP